MQNFDQCPSMCAFKKTGKSENYFEENPQRNAPSHVDGPNWLGLLQVDSTNIQDGSIRIRADVVSFKIAENPKSDFVRLPFQNC